MIDRLLVALRTATAARPPAPRDAHLALAALLVRAARADHHYAAEEAGEIEAVLSRRYGLGPDAARRLRTEAETVEAEALDTVQFTRAVKAAVPFEERFGIVVALWRIVLADGRRAEEEAGFLRLAAHLLGVNDLDSARARQEAAAG
jgi:uncharacterized tellurite resistance protein B-like protein